MKRAILKTLLTTSFIVTSTTVLAEKGNGQLDALIVMAKPITQSSTSNGSNQYFTKYFEVQISNQSPGKAVVDLRTICLKAYDEKQKEYPADTLSDKALNNKLLKPGQTVSGIVGFSDPTRTVLKTDLVQPSTNCK